MNFFQQIMIFRLKKIVAFQRNFICSFLILSSLNIQSMSQGVHSQLFDEKLIKIETLLQTFETFQQKSETFQEKNKQLIELFLQNQKLLEKSTKIIEELTKMLNNKDKTIERHKKIIGVLVIIYIITLTYILFAYFKSHDIIKIN